MLKRKTDSFLVDWKKREDHKPLIIKGARQIGKTTAIRNFGLGNYESFIEINLISNPEYKEVFSDGYQAESIIKNISLLNPAFRFIPGNTLILFDEIQEYMDLTTSLKFFKEDGRFDVICSGSALGINYKRISSVSVGYKEDYEMFSMDFEEFLWACGYPETIADDLSEFILNLKPYSDLYLKKMIQLFRDYIITGGMPAIVNQYIESGNFSGLLDAQRQIFKDYDDDIGKYTEGLETAKVRRMYHHIASQLGKENHKFMITKLGHGARAYQYQGCEEWLKEAGIVNICYCLQDLVLPLQGNEDEENYRMYFADTSLLLASLDEESQNDLRVHRNFGVYFGAMYENFAAEALVKQGYPLCFYRSADGRTELDFLIRKGDCLVPIEIKANRGKAKSLNAVIKDEKLSNIRYGIKFGNYNVGCENGVITLPYFTMFLLKRCLNTETENELAEYIHSRRSDTEGL